MKTNKSKLFSVTLPYATFSIVSTKDICTEAAPIAKWMIGKHMSVVRSWIGKTKGSITYIGES